MGADNHPTTKVAQSETTDAPSVNGHELTSLEGVEAAFGYLGKDYNDGDITRSLGGDRVLITARRRRFQHLDHLLDAHAGGHMRIADVYSVGDTRQRIEVEEY